ncbi:hypothetical protein TRFO_05022 [Tritrichomonas foetus]|uniref:Uncharacterized protein n=1 Tax=Tritrichomonas foetus TaxID=1144522 RepID=A0A1J4K8T7_9EUKA|nr:hypothetical protein TRFO_05022 [Tritrichomonas foetus]|eukprot:OHT07913.1 hypothetical protein TRFO_05022 [Tritrichomonas foetus]
MVTNVIEVYQRLKELKTTMSDKYVISIINYLESFCEICKQCYSSFSQSGEFNDDILKDISSQGIPNPNQPSKPIQQPQPQPQMQPPMQPPFQPQQPQQPAIVDDLLDLSFGSPQPPQQPQYQQPPVPQQQFSQPPPPQPFQPPFIPPPQPQAPFMPQQQMQPPKPNNDFEFADDLESGGVSDQQFTAFFNGIQTKK